MFKTFDFFKGLSWLVIEKIIRVPTGFLVNIYLINYLGKTIYGEITYAITIATFLFGLASFGISNLTVARLSKVGASSSIIMLNDFIIRLFWGLIAFFLTAIYVIFFEKNSVIIWGILILAINHILQSSRVFEDFLKATVQQKRLATYYLFQNIVVSLLKLSFVFFVFSPYLIIWVYLIENLFLSAIFFIYLIRLISFKDISKINFSEFLNVIYTAFPLFLAGTLTAMAMNVDKLFVYNALSAEVLGIYSSALLLISTMYFLPGIMTSTFIPMFVNINNVNTKSKIYVNIYRVFSFLGFSIWILFFLLSEFLVSILFTSEFSGVAELLPWLALTLPMLFIGSMTNAFLVSENKVWLILLRQSVTLMITLLALIFTIESMGIYGAILSLILGRLFGEILVDLIHKDTYEHFFWKLQSLNLLKIKISIKELAND